MSGQKILKKSKRPRPQGMQKGEGQGEGQWWKGHPDETGPRVDDKDGPGPGPRGF